ncbi:Dyp-type peroxidase [Brevibacterium sp. BRM-1]|uniref:Dyp-type peroxidase n=1 Tax=Brevibacterium sp. BRM-1 TaxID=2999062 RepID=UPI00227F8250|nr:Dyp-type peroxidase [Brevibacterium sp. BRM-1]WAL39362.1 Dyp-type peroxidase [Brevibacterium sp. BRM-1]
MVTQQVVSKPARTGMFLTLTVRPGGEDAVRAFLPALSGLTRSVSFRVPDADLLCVAGIGAQLWERLYAAPAPLQLHTLAPIEGPTHTAPSTPGDILLHLRARSVDMCFELARIALAQLGDAVTIVDEVHGFKYYDMRDLLGFVDGTANPEGDAALQSVLIGDEDPAYRGGSYVIVQKYIHDLTAWESLTVEEQQRVIGRTKLEDVELPDDVKPSNSHVALNTITDADGVEHDIFRENMPFGSFEAKEFGTFFIGYAADVSVTEQMLVNMFIGDPVGNHDRILDFSTAVTGGLFFIPSIARLDSMDALPAAPVGAGAQPAVPAPVTPANAVPGGYRGPQEQNSGTGIADAEQPVGPESHAPGAGEQAGAVEQPGAGGGDGSLGIGSLRPSGQAPQH